jgi:hypothetical protein
VTLELVIEYVRRAAFPDCTSRLQSYFAFVSLEEAKTFRAEQGPNASNLPIYRIHSDKAATVEAARKANMSTKSINGNRLLNGGSFAPAA